MSVSSSHGEFAILRTGKVSSFDPITYTARIRFEDRADLVSYPFQVLAPKTWKNSEENPLDVDEHVLCLCLGNGVERGYVIGTMYDRDNPPKTKNPDRWVKHFDDGAEIYYDRKEHVFQIKDSFGSYIRMADGKITQQSQDIIELNPDSAIAQTAGAVDDYLGAQFD